LLHIKRIFALGLIIYQGAMPLNLLVRDDEHQDSCNISAKELTRCPEIDRTPQNTIDVFCWLCSIVSNNTLAFITNRPLHSSHLIELGLISQVFSLISRQAFIWTSRAPPCQM